MWQFLVRKPSLLPALMSRQVRVNVEMFGCLESMLSLQGLGLKNKLLPRAQYPPCSIVLRCFCPFSLFSSGPVQSLTSTSASGPRTQKASSTRVGSFTGAAGGRHQLRPTASTSVMFGDGDSPECSAALEVPLLRFAHGRRRRAGLGHRRPGTPGARAREPSERSALSFQAGAP